MLVRAPCAAGGPARFAHHGGRKLSRYCIWYCAENSCDLVFWILFWTSPRLLASVPLPSVLDSDVSLPFTVLSEVSGLERVLAARFIDSDAREWLRAVSSWQGDVSDVLVTGCRRWCMLEEVLLIVIFQ